MSNQKQIICYLKDDEKNLISEASQYVSLKLSSFIRFAALEKARKISEKYSNILEG